MTDTYRIISGLRFKKNFFFESGRGRWGPFPLIRDAATGVLVGVVLNMAYINPYHYIR